MRRVCLASFALGVFACAEPTTGLSSDAGQAAACDGMPKIDTLFVVDNTSTMGPKHERLTQALPRYLGALKAACADYRIALVSMDVDSLGGERAGDVQVSFAGAPYFEIQQNDSKACRSSGLAHGCARGGVVSSAQPLADQVNQLSGAFLGLGTCASGIEAGFPSLRGFFDQTSTCNRAFVRAGSRLVIILVSDEEESSQESVDAAVSLLVGIGADRVRVGAIIGGAVDGDTFVPKPCGDSGASCGELCNAAPPMGSHAACQGLNSCGAGEQCSASRCVTSAEEFWRFCAWCAFFNAPGCCNSLGGSRFAELVDAMEAQNFAAVPASRSPSCPSGMSANCRLASVCDADWGDTLERFARTLALGP